MRPKNAIGKTLSSSPSFRSNPIRTITGPMIRRQKSSRQVGVRHDIKAWRLCPCTTPLRLIA